MSEEIEIIDAEVETLPAVRQSQAINLFGESDPAAVIARASEYATALAQVVDERNLYKQIGQKKHVLVEGWTLLGSMIGVFPVVEWSRPTEDGWEARVTAQTRSGEIVGAAEAMCSRKEGSWKNRDDYAIRSMAQTRAVSKALRHPLGFIMTLAGYEATPEAEVPSGEYQSTAAVASAPDTYSNWDEVKAALLAYGDNEETYSLFNRFGTSARKLMFGDDDLSAKQKGELFEVAAASAKALIETADPAKFPPPSEKEIAQAWAKQLEGAVLQPAP